MTIGFGSKSEVIECQRIIFEGHVECQGWNGDRNREAIDATEDKCSLQIDLTYRLVRISKPGRKVFECPLEKVQQWFRADEPTAEEKPTRGWPKGKPRKSPDSETSTAQ